MEVSRPGAIHDRQFWSIMIGGLPVSRSTAYAILNSLRSISWFIVVDLL